MADTGAPWNIPYVENADLVKDYPTASLALANAIASGLDAAGNAGIGSNVVQTVKTDVFSTTSTSLTDVTGLSVTITPTSASSKILVVTHFYAGHSTTGSVETFFLLLRGATQIAIGDPESNRPGALGGMKSISNELSYPQISAFLDSPNTTSATTYKIQVATRGGTVYVGRSGADSDTSYTPRMPAIITAIEVAA